MAPQLAPERYTASVAVRTISKTISISGWGLYGACSWTWCIGMFLPIIMLDRYGWAGFLVFAVPNLLGCAAFGYVLTRVTSEALVRTHGPMMRGFSLMTIAYHVYFLSFAAWMLLPLERLPDGGDALWLALVLPPASVSLAVLLSNLPVRAWPYFAAAVYAVSLAVFVIVGVEPLEAAPRRGARPPNELLWLIPTITFGFLLCPYLDLTFHRALRESPSHHAFTIFGIAFAVMLVLTCTYWDVFSTRLSWLIFAHIAAQSVFTMSAHVRELRVSMVPQPGWYVGAMVLATLLVLPIVFVTSAMHSPLQAGVDFYLRFLAFYGLLFPAYVLFSAARGAAEPWTRRAAVILAVGVLAASPFYELGFIHHLTWLLPIPLVVMLIAARVIRRLT